MKDIVNYEGLYAITEDGQVWSYRSKKFLSQRYDKDGYLRVTLCNKGTLKTFHIHRLVAEAFIPNPDGLPEVNHKDENKENNCVDNLEWCTHGYNMHYGTQMERAATSRQRKFVNGMSVKEASEKYHIPAHTIYSRMAMGLTDEQILA